MFTTMTLPEIRAALRETRREMKERGIRRISFMCGGHSPESYLLNARMFELENYQRQAKAAAANPPGWQTVSS